jgi:toxin CptA
VQFPITIGLHRSRFQRLVLFLFAVVTTAVITAYPRSTGIFTLFLVACWGLVFLANHRLTPRFKSIRLERDGRIAALRFNQLDPEPMRLLPGATIHPWLVAFRLASQDGKKYSILLTADTLQADEFRRLRVFLRWRAKISGSDGDA